MILLPVFIIIPVTACIIEYFFIKLKTKYEGLIPLIASLITVVLSLYSAFNVPNDFYLPWIHQWNIDIEFSLNGISNIFMTTCSIAFLVQTILSLNKQKRQSYWCMNLFLQAAIFSFILSQNLAVKIISWELCWVPIFVILVNTEKGHTAIRFSKIWFFAQALLICGTIIMIGKFSRIYDAAFWLMLVALITRTYLNISSRFKSEITILINVIVPLLPIIFFTNTLLPSFYKYIETNTLIIAISLCIINLIWIFKLIASRAIHTIYTVNVAVFSGFILVWLLKPELQVLQLCIQIVVVKTILGIIMTYYGRDCSCIRNKWVLIISLLLSFGFSGIIIGIPMLKIISLWNTYQQAIAISILCLLFVLFTATVVKISKLFNYQKTEAKKQEWPEIIKLVTVSIIFIGIVSALTELPYIKEQVKKPEINNAKYI